MHKLLAVSVSVFTKICSRRAGVAPGGATTPSGSCSRTGPAKTSWRTCCRASWSLSRIRGGRLSRSRPWHRSARGL
eukprot:15406137-Heterocapsa_arctica.AAC.1